MGSNPLGVHGHVRRHPSAANVGAHGGAEHHSEEARPGADEGESEPPNHVRAVPCFPRPAQCGRSLQAAHRPEGSFSHRINVGERRYS